MVTKVWNDEKDATLKRLYLAGVSKTEIAAELGVTPHAVNSRLRKIDIERDNRTYYRPRPERNPTITLPKLKFMEPKPWEDEF